MKKYDCFAIGENGCKVLTYMYCAKGKACPFYKSMEQHEKDMEKYPWNAEKVREAERTRDYRDKKRKGTI